MPEIFKGAVLTRDDLATGLTQLARDSLRPFTWTSIAETDIPDRGVLIGSWSDEPGDPLPELLVVRDEDHVDTLAWLSSYFGPLAPLTQWCRIVTRTQAERISGRPQHPSLGRRLGVWVGATVAECSAQAGGSVNLRELPGSAAMSTSTYAAGRATAVWGEHAIYPDLARRHDELSQSLREGGRPVSASHLSTIWQLLSGDPAHIPTADRRALEPLSDLLNSAIANESQISTADLVQLVATKGVANFDLKELGECARGPQVDRVRALDRLADRLVQDPRSPAIDALLGFGASLVDPGAVVLPDLLRKYRSSLPLASIWLGAFAGAWSPVRVLTEHQGLGRLIAKAMLAPTDLQTRPSCDIAYEELSRWLAPGKSSQKLDLRGMSARILLVEITLGVTSAFSFGRVEPTAQLTSPRAEAAREGGPEQRQRGLGQRSLAEVDSLLTSLLHRMDRIEQVAAIGQPSLDLAEPGNVKPKRTGRPPYQKR